MSVSIISQRTAPKDRTVATGKAVLYPAATFSLAAALIHLWVMPEHLQEWWGYGAFFLVVAVAQAALALVLLRRPVQPLLLAGFGGNLAIVGLYVMTRTVGVPFFGPHAWHPEGVGALDLAATGSQIALVGALLMLLDGRYRARAASALLTLAAMGALAAGAWGASSSLGAEASPARVGEPVAVSGGEFAVDRAYPWHMAPMQMGKFANAGMNMSGATNMDMPPEGQRRFYVEVTLGAEAGAGLSYSPEDFRISGEGMKESGPYQSKLKAGTVPAGSMVSGSMAFQVPEEASELMLSLDGGRAIALDLEPVKGEGEGSSHEGSSHGGGHH
jgi:hypothetical protein